MDNPWDEIEALAIEVVRQGNELLIFAVMSDGRIFQNTIKLDPDKIMAPTLSGWHVIDWNGFPA